LKQLDKSYNHPNYVVDFLLFFRDTNEEHKIIVEYDGFLEHFDDVDEVDKFNYQRHYSEEDIFRRKTLEGYGYKFLRLNKFNIGKEPIAALDERIRQLTRRSIPSNNLLYNIHSTVEGLQKGDMKECPKCKQVRKLEDFWDPSLITEYGRFCRNCKEIKEVSTRKEIITVKDKSDITCPKCGSYMVPRTGRYGPFWGCTRFPYCKGTRNRS
jgi:very-short-patch-repair endonuclease